MPNPPPQDRLQPSLLDRLTDEQPEEKQESRDKRVLSLRQLREAVLRDLTWLLNTSDFSSVQEPEEYPFVSRSVLNYGMPPLAGNTASSTDVRALEKKLKQAISEFEPRILRQTLKVRAIVAEDEMNHNAINFDIEGELWAQPVPMRLFLRTEVDLENGTVTVRETSGKG